MRLVNRAPGPECHVFVRKMMVFFVYSCGHPPQDTRHPKTDKNHFFIVQNTSRRNDTLMTA